MRGGTSTQRARLGWAVPLLFAMACGAAVRDPDAICDSPVERYAGTVSLTDRLDVLFVLDTSGSMVEERQTLVAQMPGAARFLIDGLTRQGDRFDRTTNFHVGVVSADLGGRAGAADGCSEAGDDARLQAAPACHASRGDYVWHRSPYHDPAETAAAMSCIVELPESSCAVSQPLEAGLKAFGRNSDFESSTAEYNSFLVIVIVTDRDDVSPGTVQDYVRRFRSLRPGAEQLVQLVVIAGIPPDLLTRSLEEAPSDEDATAIYLRMLDDPRLAAADVPSCTSPTAVAYTPRRFIELAAAWPSNVSLRSICDYDLSHALGHVAGTIGKKLSRGPVCLKHPVTRDSEGRVPCRVFWELPDAVDPDEPFTPAACEDLPDLLSVPSGDPTARSRRGRTVCELRQAPVEKAATGAFVPRGEGFYVDPQDPFMYCGDTSHGMLKWTKDAIAPSGVRMLVQCGEEPTSPAARSCDIRPECLGGSYSCLDGELRRE
jgi:hypothetical protein